MKKRFDVPAASATILRENFAVFVARAFRHFHQEELAPTPHILALCHALEQVFAGEFRNFLGTTAPRQLKSFITTVCYPAWVLGRNPRLKLICVAYSAELAETHARMTREIMQSDWYKEAFPKTRLDPKRNKIDEFHTTAHGFRMARSLSGSITGFGGDYIILDDAQNAADFNSEAERRAVHEKYATVLPSRLDNPKTGAMIVVAQRLHLDDLPGRLIQEGGWRHLNLPMTAPVDQDIEIAPGKIWHRKAGTLLNPERFGPEEVEKYKKQLTPAQYAAQYDQNPEAPEGAIFKLSSFKRFTETEFRRPFFEQVLISWDTSLSTSETACYSAATVWGIRGLDHYLIKAFRGRLCFTEIMDKMIEFHEHYRRLVENPLTLIENAASGMMLSEELYKQGHRWFFAVTPEGSKMLRAQQQTVKIEAGRVHIPSERPSLWLKAFEGEIAGFPYARYNDWVDSMTQALHFLDTHCTHPALRELSMNNDKRGGVHIFKYRRRPMELQRNY